MKKKILFSLTALIAFCSIVQAAAQDLSFEAKTAAENPAAGDIVTFGKFNGSDLSWLVLDVDETNNRALLITENCVAKQAFAQSNYEWSNSYVRAYLNGTDGNNFFTSSNFTDDEKAKILKISINKNNLSKKSSEIISSSGSDYVFLLGVTDANKYFESNEKRICNFNNSAVKWWLRYSTQSYARAGYVSTKGKVMSDGSLVSYTTVGVRPAIWVTLPINDSTENGTTTTDSVTADGNSILEMTYEEIEAKYSNKTNITITGTLDSAEKLSNILKSINNENIMPVVENLDLRKLNISEVDLDDVTIWYINLEGNTNIKKFATKNSSVISLDFSESSVQEIDINNCEILNEVTLENCKEALKVNFSGTFLAKLVVTSCENLTTLSCENSALKNLDINGCTNLTTLNLENNSLPRLKISKTDFPNLTEFTCGSQKITSKVSKSFNFNNFLQDLEASSATAADVSELDSIKNIQGYDTSGNKIDYELDENTGDITFDREPYTLIYDYDTGFEKNGENVLMNVNVSISNAERWGAGGGEDIIDSGVSLSGTSGGACNSGFGFVALGLLLNLILKKFAEK